MRIEFRNVSKKYITLGRRVTALRDITLSIEPGELFVLLGPSGCGKSTLLNLTAGMEKPTSGEILLGGRVVASRRQRIFMAPKDRDVAMVFQSYALYPHLKVRENIAFPLKIAKVSREQIRDSVHWAAATLGIEELLEAMPGELSGGQRQRVAIARAIVRRPGLFLLDEPLSNLDAGLRASTRTELKRLQRELGITTIYVTHDQVEAMTLGDRVALLNQGRIEQTGSPAELYDHPRTPFAARFIGAPPMNLIPGNLLHDGSTPVLEVGGARMPVTVEQTRDLSPGRCLVGIRPEHADVGQEESLGLEGMITVRENLGREALVHVAVNDLVVSVLTTRTDLMEGDRVSLHLHKERIHLFPAQE